MELREEFKSGDINGNLSTSSVFKDRRLSEITEAVIRRGEKRS